MFQDVRFGTPHDIQRFVHLRTAHMAAKTFVLDHNPLGTITGVEVSNLPVTNFLGVKYASVKERFAESELFEHATQDTTRFGCVYLTEVLR